MLDLPLWWDVDGTRSAASSVLCSRCFASSLSAAVERGGGVMEECGVCGELYLAQVGPHRTRPCASHWVLVSGRCASPWSMGTASSHANQRPLDVAGT